MSKSVINKMMIKYVAEICLTVCLIVVSFSAINNANLSSSASIASSNATIKYDIQYSYSRDKEDTLAYFDLLDRGVLTLRNPNKVKEKVDVILVLYGDITDLEDFQITFGEENVDLTNMTSEDNVHKLVLSTVELEGYANYSGTLSIYGNPIVDTTLAYDFTIEEIYRA